MSLIATISFGVCALAFLLLTAMLVRRFPGGAPAVLLAAASAATTVWAAVFAWSGHYGGIPAYTGELAETIRSGLWLLFLSELLSSVRFVFWPRLLRMGVWVVLLPPLFAVALGFLSDNPTALESGIDGPFVYAGLLVALTGLLLLEQVYRNMAPERRWALKHVSLGVGLLLAFDLYLYADALLFQRLDPTIWQARGAVDALAVPLIMVSAARNPTWSADVFVSRHVAFHTTTLMAAGAYLIVMSLGGYYIRDYGGTWGGFLQVLFLAAGGVLLVLLLASGELRARLRVFLSKHFFSNKYDYREEWLALIQRLSEESDDVSPPKRAVRAVAAIFDSPGGAVWLRREEDTLSPAGDWRVAVPDGAELSGDDPLAVFLRDSKWVVELSEHGKQPERYGHLVLPEWLTGIPRAWVIVPLMQQDTLFGMMLLCRPAGPIQITWEDRDLLKTLGRQIAIYLGQHENAQALSQARQFEAFNRLTAFLMHDLKNLIAQQSLVVKNAEKHKHNPEFVDDAMMTIGNSVRRMERLLEHLQRGQTDGAVERVNLGELLDTVARRCSDRPPRPTMEPADTQVWVEAERYGLSMVLTHVVRNAQDATSADGCVAVALSTTARSAVIDIEDDGEGMDEAFVRERLFRPFYSTKASKGMGIGAHQAREFVRSCGGSVSIASSPGQGTRFRIELPLCPEAGDREIQDTGGVEES